jgi:hypothetical protein
MSATAEDVLTLALRNIEVGPVVQQRRAAPTESDLWWGNSLRGSRKRELVAAATQKFFAPLQTAATYILCARQRRGSNRGPWR